MALEHGLGGHSLLVIVTPDPSGLCVYRAQGREVPLELVILQQLLTRSLESSSFEAYSPSSSSRLKIECPTMSSEGSVLAKFDQTSGTSY